MHEEEKTISGFDPDRFEYRFIGIPFRGRKGSVVKTAANPDGHSENYEEYGVLMTDTAEWENFLRRVKEKNLYVDFSDMAVTACFLTPHGVWSHKHINPLDLEIDANPPTPKDRKAAVYLQALDAFSKYWLETERSGAEEKDDPSAKSAIRLAQDYRDACLEAYVQSQKSTTCDCAKTIREIMA